MEQSIAGYGHFAYLGQLIQKLTTIVNSKTKAALIGILKGIIFIPAGVLSYVVAKWFVFLCAMIANPKVLPVIQNEVEGFGGYYINGPWAVLFSEAVAIAAGAFALYTLMPRNRVVFWIFNALAAGLLIFTSFAIVSAYSSDIISGGELAKESMRAIVRLMTAFFFGVAFYPFTKARIQHPLEQ